MNVYKLIPCLHAPFRWLTALLAVLFLGAPNAFSQTIASLDIGPVGVAGSSAGSGASWDVSGSGSDIWSGNDTFRFTYFTLTGDADLVVRVASQTNTNAWAKAGLMIRESLTRNSTHASVFSTPSNGVAMQRRLTTAGTSTGTTVSTAGSPRWLRLVRSGNTFTGYRSTDGQVWTQITSVSIAMGAQVYAGLAVTSHNNTALSAVQFRDFSTGQNSGPSEVILDNSSAGVTVTGSWAAATSPAGFYGTNFLHDQNSGKGAKSVRYTPALAPGVYAVSVYYPPGTNRAADVPVDVVHADGADYLSLNQNTGGGGWFLLGNFRFEATGGYVEIGNDGTSAQVIADAVKFSPTGAKSDVETIAEGLVSWRKPDGDGISCAQCHTPMGYDVALFDFDQADLRRATAPHLTDADADKITEMLRVFQRYYPPSGGLKDVETFRPFQPGNGVILGGAGSSNRVRDNAFADYLAANFLLAQPGHTVDTLAEANAALTQLANTNFANLPVGLEFNKWSESVSRSGANEGGRVAEWLPGIGQQPKSANLTQWNAAVDAYLADPTDANFWSMFHLIDTALVADPVNSAPSAATHTPFLTQARRQFQANNLFAHSELNKARGLPELQFTDGIRPFPDQAATHPSMAVNWDVGDMTRINVNGGSFTLAQMPLRHQESIWTGGTGADSFKERYDDLRIP
jgi:regulation of enolase protein 1 (concanavalin A-like superfamily)